MRFVCDSCRAQYMISDDKVGAKGVKVRCKKCGYVILVRRPEPEPEADESTRVAVNPFAGDGALSLGGEGGAAAPTSPGESPSRSGSNVNALLGSVEDDEIGAVFDQVLKDGPGKQVKEAGAASAPSGDDAPPEGDDDFESTRVVSADTLNTLKKLAAESSPHTIGERPAVDSDNGEQTVPGTLPVPANDWFVAVDEEQVGPLTLDRVKELWDSGKIGADSLCWRAGLPDWMPLSEATELASVLAPRPTRPVIVAPAAVSGPNPVLSGPVESAFSAGVGPVPGRATGEVPAAPPSDPAESGGWQPSAASSLLALAAQEVEALSKPAPRPAPKVEEAPLGGLLDVPPPEPATVAAAPANGRLNGFPQMPVSELEAPRSAQAPNVYAGPTTPYPPPSYGNYPPPPAPAPAAGTNRTLLFAGIGLGTVMIGLLAFIAIRLTSSSSAAVPASPLVAPSASATRSPPPAPLELRPAPVAPANPPVQGGGTVAQVAPAQGGGTSPAQVATTQGGGTPAQVATTQGGGTPAPGTPVTAPAPAAEVKPGSAPTAPRQAGTTTLARADTGSDDGAAHSSSRGHRRNTGREHSGSLGSSAVDEAPVTSTPQKTVNSKPSSDEDDFDNVFKTGGDKPQANSGGSTGHKTSVYIPSEPGAGGNVPARLGQSDIMTVILAHRPAIVNCVNEQKKKNPALGGRLVMRWTVLPSGKTSSVSVRSDEFKSTYMAGCLSGLIKGLSFPRHKIQGEPIDFPFTF